MFRRLLYRAIHRARTGSRPCDKMCTQTEYMRLCEIAQKKGCDLPYWPSIAEAREIDLWLWGHTGTVSDLLRFIASRRGNRRCRICGCTDDNGCSTNRSLFATDRGVCHWVERDLCSSCELVFHNR